MKPVKFVIDTAASPVKHVPNLLAERGNSLPTVEAKYTRCRKDETGIMVLLPVSSKYGLSEYLFLIIIILFFIQKSRHAKKNEDPPKHRGAWSSIKWQGSIYSTARTRAIFSYYGRHFLSSPKETWLSSYVHPFYLILWNATSCNTLIFFIHASILWCEQQNFLYWRSLLLDPPSKLEHSRSVSRHDEWQAAWVYIKIKSDSCGCWNLYKRTKPNACQYNKHLQRQSPSKETRTKRIALAVTSLGIGNAGSFLAFFAVDFIHEKHCAVPCAPYLPLVASPNAVSGSW